MSVCAAKEINLWVISYLFSPVWAGPAERFLRYGRRFRERGIEMTIVTAMRPNQPRGEIRNGIRIERIGNSEKDVASVESFLARAILRAVSVRRRPDFMLFLSVGPFLPLFLLILKIAGIKSIYVGTMARLDPERPRSFRKWMLNRLTFLAYNAFDCLVCSTQALMNDLTVLGIRREKVKIIPNGVSLTRFRPAGSSDEIRSVRQTLGLPVDGPIVLYVGLRTDRKGVIELVEAWRRYRAGGGSGWLVMVGQELRDDAEFRHFYERWDRCVAQIRPADQIELRGPHAQIEEYFRSADVFVFLSELEGTPNVVLEAMASGLPVLTTRFRGFSTELGRDSRELIITERDPEKVSEELARLINNRELRQSLAINGRAWVEGYQNIDESISQYTALLQQSVMNGRRRV